MQTLFVIAAAVVCFAFAVFIARKGLRQFREGRKILGSFITVVSIQFFIYPLLMLITVLG